MEIFLDMLAGKEFITNGLRTIGKQPITKSERLSAVKARIHWLSNECFVLPSVYIVRICFVRFSEESYITILFDASDGTRDGCHLGGPARRRPVLLGRTSPRSAAPLCAASLRTARVHAGLERAIN